MFVLIYCDLLCQRWLWYVRSLVVLSSLSRWCMKKMRFFFSLMEIDDNVSYWSFAREKWKKKRFQRFSFQKNGLLKIEKFLGMNLFLSLWIVSWLNIGNLCQSRIIHIKMTKMLLIIIFLWEITKSK